MKFYRVLIRIIWSLLIICMITLIVCVVRLEKSSEDKIKPLNFSVRRLILKDEDGKLPFILSGVEEEAEGTKEEEITEPEADETVSRRIVCWGDSLTESADERTAYPDVLRELTGLEVLNYGIRSDTSLQIGAREGGVPVYTDSLTIPGDTSAVRVRLRLEDKSSISFLKYGDSGLNPCMIGGVLGELSLLEDGGYGFRRLSKGEKVKVEKGERLVTYGMQDKDENDILVIFSGTNDGLTPEAVDELIDIQRAMIEYSETSKYVVIGMTCKKVMPEIEEINRLLYEEYGDSFLDIRKYMLEYGLESEGLKATGADREDIASGEIPSSLRADYVHGNKYFYDIIAKQLYEKLIALGYI